MTAEPIDLGHGHTLRWTVWKPDRELNPQYEGIPDLEKCTGIIAHPLRPDDEQCRDLGYCRGAFTPESETTRRLFPEQALWQVSCWEPLTVSPSILCHCGDHGFIQGGCWVPA
jgi:hypothetical protein